jgi:hypothetical protein
VTESWHYSQVEQPLRARAPREPGAFPHQVLPGTLTNVLTKGTGLTGADTARTPAEPPRDLAGVPHSHPELWRLPEDVWQSLALDLTEPGAQDEPQEPRRAVDPLSGLESPKPVPEPAPEPAGPSSSEPQAPEPHWYALTNRNGMEGWGVLEADGVHVTKWRWVGDLTEHDGPAPEPPYARPIPAQRLYWLPMRAPVMCFGSS